MIRGFRSNRQVAFGANNTDLIRQTGALAAYCWVGDAPGRDRAWQNILSIARGIIQPDGSDVEGSPGYAMYIEKLLVQAERSAGTCGIPATEISALRGLLYQFVAQAVRPDFKLTSVGDTINQSLRGTFGVGDWRADWIRSGGTAGAPPTPVYTAFDGGYAFGRAGWNPPARRPGHLLLDAVLVDAAQHPARARRRRCADVLLPRRRVDRRSRAVPLRERQLAAVVHEVAPRALVVHRQQRPARRRATACAS